HVPADRRVDLGPVAVHRRHDPASPGVRLPLRGAPARGAVGPGRAVDPPAVGAAGQEEAAAFDDLGEKAGDAAVGGGPLDPHLLPDLEPAVPGLATVSVGRKGSLDQEVGHAASRSRTRAAPRPRPEPPTTVISPRPRPIRTWRSPASSRSWRATSPAL